MRRRVAPSGSVPQSGPPTRQVTYAIFVRFRARRVGWFIPTLRFRINTQPES
jgi:hypothetical protein